MRSLRQILHRPIPQPELPPPNIRPHDRNDLAYLRAYDGELKRRFRMLELDAEVMARRTQEGRS